MLGLLTPAVLACFSRCKEPRIDLRRNKWGKFQIHPLQQDDIMAIVPHHPCQSLLISGHTLFPEPKFRLNLLSNLKKLCQVVESI